MNILDIIMAKKLATKDTSEAVDKANAAVDKANEAVNKANKVSEQAQIVANEAEQTLEDANAAVETANTTNDSTKQLVEQAQGLVNDAQSTLDTLAETVNTADEAVQKVAAIEEQAQQASELAQSASDSFNTMKEDLLTAAEGLVDEAVVEVVNRELTNLNDHMDQVDTTVKGFESTVATYDEKINYLTDTLPEVNAAAFEADKAARAAQKTADDAAQVGRDNKLRVNDLETTTNLLGVQMTMVADKVDSVEEGISTLQTQQSATDTKVSTLETNVGQIETTVDELKDNAIDVTIKDQSDETADIQEITITKGEAKQSHKFKTYKAVDESEDGAITPKAAKTYVDEAKAYLEQKIEEATAGDGGISNLGPENAGKTVFVGEDGNIAAGTITEDDLVKMATVLGMYQSDDVVGIEVDYVNKVYSRLQGSMSLTPGADFDQFEMYGGRRRCVVDNTGTIIAFEGEEEYNDDGSVGQVMVYQPKFYYLRTPLSTTGNSLGISVTKEQILLTYVKTQGFRIHPLFVDENGQELEYVLLPAYEGSIYDSDAANYIKDDNNASIDYDADILSSVAGVKPASTITLANFEKLAKNRGAGWMLTNAKAESVNQLLMAVEYGSFNIQNTLGRGICDLENSNSKNIALLTGSTSSLGSKSGQATSSKDEEENTYTENGKVAVSYRGYENPYGNIWRQVDGITFVGSGAANGGVVNVDGTPTNYKMPNASDWISCFANDTANDWLLMPGSIRLSANSTLPVGDYYYVTPNSNRVNECMIGGKASAGDYAGPFAYYAALASGRSEKSINARIMFIPKRDTVYEANCEKWKALIGG